MNKSMPAASLRGEGGRSAAGQGVRARRGRPAAGPARRPETAPELLALLRRLAAPGAFLAPGPADGGWMLGLTGARPAAGGTRVSLGGGPVPEALARAALEAGLVEEEKGQGRARRRLVLSAAGRARLARAQATAAPFLAQHAGLDAATLRVGGVATAVTVNHRESPLAWLRRRRGRDGAPLIDEAAWLAGERFRADFERAQLAPRLTVNWERPAGAVAGAGAPGPSDMAVAARQRLRRALDAVGPEFAGVLLDVCGFLKGLEQLERERGWPARSGKVALAMALARLAAHYGLQREAAGPPWSRTRLWRA
ncbi:DUF6456 domain-containing protein [Camelimonas abortus]|uniref:DUF6456 domain-containing protein n=1 Tax=Camelimonas abortus TaxID=1017184 RepID=UPI0035E7F005